MSNIQELLDFEWFNYQPTEIPKLEKISLFDTPKNETDDDRKLRMLRQVSKTCMACSMCQNGTRPIIIGNEIRDPHAFSNMRLSKYMIVKSKPDWNDLCKGVASDYRYYKTSLLKCYTDDITKEDIKLCNPLIQIELNIVKPVLIATVGKIVFNHFCECDYNSSIGKIVKGREYKVFSLPEFDDTMFNVYLNKLNVFIDVLENAK